MRRSWKIIGTAAVMAFAVACTGVSPNATRKYENFDGPLAVGKPGATSAKIEGNPAVLAVGTSQYVAYLSHSDATAIKYSLRFAAFEQGVWSKITLDGAGSSIPGATTDSIDGRPTMISHQGQIHVFYIRNLGATNRLRHAWRDGGAWNFEDLDGAGVVGGNGRTGSSGFSDYLAATATSTRIVVAYSTSGGLAAEEGRLRIAEFAPSSGWSFSSIDGGGTIPGSSGKYLVRYEMAALTANDVPHVFYNEETTDVLRHAWRDGESWRMETLDGDGGPNGRSTESLGEYVAATLYRGAPHVFYTGTDETTVKRNGTLRHSWFESGEWKFEVLDGNPVAGSNGRVATDVGYFNAAVSDGKRVYVYYTDDQTSDLRTSVFDGSAWSASVIDGADSNEGRTTNAVSSYAAAAFANQGVHVYYLDTTAYTLRHTWLD